MKKVLSVLLALILVLQLFPAVLATDASGPKEGQAAAEIRAPEVPAALARLSPESDTVPPTESTSPEAAEQLPEDRGGIGGNHAFSETDSRSDEAPEALPPAPDNPNAPTYQINVSKTPVLANLNDASFPSGVSTATAGEKYYFNFATAGGSNDHVTMARLYVKAQGESSYTNIRTLTPNNDWFHWGNVDSDEYYPFTTARLGTLYYYWVFTMWGGSTFTTSTQSIQIKTSMAVTQTPFKDHYDGNPHSISLSVSGPSSYTVYYSLTTELTGSNYSSAGSTTKPTKTLSGGFTTYWYIVDNTGKYFNQYGHCWSAIYPNTTSTDFSDYYDGSAHSPTVTVAGGATLYYSTTTQLDLSNYTSGSTSIPTRTNSGTTKVYYVAIPNANDECGTSGTTYIHIFPKTSSTSYSGTYDGSSHKPTVNVSGNATLYYSTSGALSYSDYSSAGSTTCPTRTNAGTTKVYYFAVPNSNPSENSWSRSSTTINIKPKVTVSAYSGTYDGSSHKPTISVSGGATLYYSTSTQLTFSNYSSSGSTTLPSRTNAGTSTVYYIAVPSSGATSNSCTTGSTSITIGKNAMSASASGYSGTYDGSSHSPTVTVSGPSSYTVYYSTSTQLTSSNYSSSGSTTKPTRTNAGENTVYYYVKDGTGNYNDYANSSYIRIKPKVSASAYSGTYDGSAHKPTVSVSGGATLYYSTSTQLTFSNYSSSGSTTLPSRTSVGTTTVYYIAVPSSGATSNTCTAGSTSITINGSTPTITTQPTAQSVPEGASVTLRVNATGTGTLSYQWQMKQRGESAWTDWSGKTSSSVTFTASKTLDGCQFRCRVSNSVGSVTSTPVTLTVLYISTQPKSATVVKGSSATFTVAASGTTPLSCQWQYKKAGESAWSDWAGATSTSFTVKGYDTNNQCQYRCKVSDSGGTVYSSAATLTVLYPPVITNQPVSKSVDAGKSVSFSVIASGTTPLSYQWQYKKVGETAWTDWSGKTSQILSVTGSATNNGYQYRCKVSNSAGSVFSNAATLTVTDSSVVAPTITNQPVSKSVDLGNSVSFSVIASGTTPLSYQWQYKKAGESSWTDWSGKTSSSLPVTGSATNNGCQYRCVVSNSAGSVTSAAATLTVTGLVVKPSITTQPMPYTVAVGNTATFSVAASGTSPLSYQWQYKKAGESSWTTWSGRTSSSLSVTGSATNNGCQYRCVVSNSAGSVTSAAATLTVTGLVVKPSITTQPMPYTVAVGNTATFSVAASGSGLSYQWQYKKAGESAWTTWSGKTKSSLSVTGSATNNGCQYRCVVSNSAGSVTSAAATLTVIGSSAVAPTISTQPMPYTVAVGSSATFSVTASGTSPLSYQWQYKKAGESAWTDWSGKTKFSLSVTGSATNNGCQYRCKVSNSAGSVTSAAATLTVTGLVSKPSITSQPESKTVAIGSTATFKVVASGSGLKYQWQYKKSGESAWTDWSGKTSASLSVTGSATNNGCQYRCKVSNGGGTVYSNAATLTVTQSHSHNYSYAVTRKPTRSAAGVLTGTCSCEDKTTVTLPKLDTYNYTWQTIKAPTCTADGLSQYTWVNTKYGNYQFDAALMMLSHSMSGGTCTRCGVKASQLPAITTQPMSATVAKGSSVTFKVVASGSGTLTYQWQYKKADEEVWHNWSGKTSASVTVTGSATNNGCMYRCIVTSSVHSGAVAYSGEVKLTVTGT